MKSPGKRPTLTLQPANGPPLWCGLDQLLHLGQGLTRLDAPLLCDICIEQVFPKGTVTPEVDDHGLPAATSIDDELDARHFLE